MKFVQLSSGPHWADTVPRRDHDGPACLKRVGDAHRHVSASSIGCVAGFRACQCVIADRSSVHSVGACVRQMLTCASTCAAHPRSGGARPLSAVPRDSVRPQSGRQRSIRCVLTRLPEAQHATLTRGCFLQCCCRADAALQRHGRAAGCYARGCACPSSPGHAGGCAQTGCPDQGRWPSSPPSVRLGHGCRGWQVLPYPHSAWSHVSCRHTPLCMRLPLFSAAPHVQMQWPPIHTWLPCPLFLLRIRYTCACPGGLTKRMPRRPPQITPWVGTCSNAAAPRVSAGQTRRRTRGGEQG